MTYAALIFSSTFTSSGPRESTASGNASAPVYVRKTHSLSNSAHDWTLVDDSVMYDEVANGVRQFAFAAAVICAGVCPPNAMGIARSVLLFASLFRSCSE